VPSTYSIQSPARLLHCEYKVSQLIDVETSWWKVPLIQETFSRERQILFVGCQSVEGDKAIGGFGLEQKMEIFRLEAPIIWRKR
jgi:hypothetical protein